MTRKKVNCWQYFKCGREVGGANTDTLGVCPAASDASFDKINSGVCGGRFCWAVAGTFCGDQVQGSFAQKRASCFDCRFYKLVQMEEGTANLRSKFLRFVLPDSGPPLLNNLRLKLVKAGSRFITQGSPAGESYIIQRGACLLVVEKDGELIPIDHRAEGDIVGVKAVLTSEPHGAHYEAETDMELWVLEKEKFDNITRDDPELLYFLTEIVADRFDSRRPISERMIGHYAATDIIGRGGYSIVYKGVDNRTGAPVAIKMLRHHMAMNSDLMACFRNEAKIIGAMDHENIIRIYDIEEGFRTIFIIMEYLEGKPLAELLEHGGITDADTMADLLRNILKGLGYAHDQGIIHRDINPQNIMVLNNDGLKILDFGFACPIGTEDLEMGTIFYTPPEQIAGEPMDQRADIYSVGIMAYEMATGKRPFPEENLGDLMESHLEQEIPDPAALAPGLAEELRTFILKACRCNPAERLTDADMALEMLRPLGETKPAGPIPPRARPGAQTYGISHMGLARPVNQDRYLIREYADGGVLIAVADGMGGSAGGDIAADIMIERLDGLQLGPAGFAKQFADLVMETDMAILNRAEENSSLEGMGTTVTGALICNGSAHWFHVGDSRLYHLRAGKLQQITRDQNLVQYFLDKGKLSPSEARVHPSRHFLEQNVGCGGCEPETGRLELAGGDLLVLTTDGLNNELPMKTIAGILESKAGIKEKGDTLLHATLQAGAKDNATVVLAEIRP